MQNLRRWYTNLSPLQRSCHSSCHCKGWNWCTGSCGLGYYKRAWIKREENKGHAHGQPTIRGFHWYDSLPPVVINGTNIKYVDIVKNLGIWITPTLNWDLYVSNIQSKVYGALKSLNFHRRSFSYEIKKQLVQTLVMPHFYYAAVVYNHLHKIIT